MPNVYSQRISLFLFFFFFFSFNLDAVTVYVIFIHLFLSLRFFLLPYDIQEDGYGMYKAKMKNHIPKEAMAS
ncbi:hypothetical protein J3F83DRAFT_732876 [Trichoderma novae-zelandiae]